MLNFNEKMIFFSYSSLIRLSISRDQKTRSKNRNSVMILHWNPGNLRIPSSVKFIFVIILHWLLSQRHSGIYSFPSKYCKMDRLLVDLCICVCVCACNNMCGIFAYMYTYIWMPKVKFGSILQSFSSFVT